jgi:hypothetical protein
MLTIGLLLMLAGPASGKASASFLYPLASFSGPVLSQWAMISVDPERNEVYVLRPRKWDVHIFDQHGMEIYEFEGFISARDIAAGDNGEILLLTNRYGKWTIHLCNYRGEELSEVTLRNVPEAFSTASPDRLVYRNGLLYLLDSERLTVIVANADGSFIAGHDFKTILWELWNADEDDEEARALEELTATGFDVDEDGGILFTVASLFTAFRLSPEGELRSFGRAGSGRGKFGVVAGIAAAPTGHVLVTDRLRCVVLIFNRDLVFQSEFGYRGWTPSNLIAPNDVAIDAYGNVYVSQAANRGVSVFRMVDDTGTPGVSPGNEEESFESVESPAEIVD